MDAQSLVFLTRKITSLFWGIPYIESIFPCAGSLDPCNIYPISPAYTYVPNFNTMLLRTWTQLTSSAGTPVSTMPTVRVLKYEFHFNWSFSGCWAGQPSLDQSRWRKSFCDRSSENAANLSATYVAPARTSAWFLGSSSSPGNILRSSRTQKNMTWTPCLALSMIGTCK